MYAHLSPRVANETGSARRTAVPRTTLWTTLALHLPVPRGMRGLWLA